MIDKTNDKEIMVSVICCAFNHEKYIAKTLDSIVTQKTDFKYEIIIHDDASNDKTVYIIEEYAKRYPNLIVPVFQKENQYSKHIDILFQFCLPRARGKYLAFCECDDFWTDSKKLQKEVDVLEKDSSISYVCHSSYLVDKDGFLIGKKASYNSSCFIPTESIITIDRNSFTTASILIRKKIFEDYPREFMKSPVGDVMLKIYGAFNGDVYFLNDICSAYRLSSPGSWTSRNNSYNARKSFTEEMNYFYGLLNRYSNNKYNDLFERIMLENEFDLLKFGNNYKAVKSDKFLSIYKKMSKKSRMLLYLRIKHNHLFSFYSKLTLFIKKLLYKFKKI